MLGISLCKMAVHDVDVGMIGFERGEASRTAILQPPPLFPVSEFLLA